MAHPPSARRGQHRFSPPKVPDLVPLMNLFLTIIPFLLLMLIVTQIAMIALNFTQGTANEKQGGGLLSGSQETQKKIPEITIIIMASQDSLGTTFPGFEIREPDKSKDTLGLLNGYYDFVKLDVKLKDIRQRYPDLQDISVAPYDDVLYDTLIKTIDLCRENNFSNIHYKAPQVRYFAQEVK
ncbi:MAG: biopolymer transporter ExbD [Candidatus Cloacimonadaceae bacterium]|jgi:hypothetical protein|nr:biopolymer transporter ExbD [Candidatus Cloacimonadota bacterium]MCB5258245.1 biopolymer transporter ExbD [Candidatus Cloacimonadota bacterium]MDD5625501.1 biopolymer transporter ExbD [Candidatus Cloacimonadota bacterium]MDY0112247.1 biopolymer transporter ExbD [Candidatus Syntrophosphaera sp.]